MNWQSVKSSNIEALAYDPEKKILSVRFIKSGIYHCLDVPQNIFDEFLNAESVGKYFAERIKGVFEVEKEVKKCEKCGTEMKITERISDEQKIYLCPECDYSEPVG
jgi:Zn finger protein HypA/HybF involved in hydrogenase expression